MIDISLSLLQSTFASARETARAPAGSEAYDVENVQYSCKDLIYELDRLRKLGATSQTRKRTKCASFNGTQVVPADHSEFCRECRPRVRNNLDTNLFCSGLVNGSSRPRFLADCRLHIFGSLGTNLQGPTRASTGPCKMPIWAFPAPDFLEPFTNPDFTAGRGHHKASLKAQFSDSTIQWRPEPLRTPCPKGAEAST